MIDELSASLSSFMGRPAVRLSNGLVRASIETEGGMVSELGIERDGRLLNPHWIPPFREETGAPWSETLHGSRWKSKLLYLLAGDFVCSPTFGPGGDIDGAELPPHGWTANERWELVRTEADTARGFAYADLRLTSRASAWPLVWTRREFVVSGQSALFSTLSIRNEGSVPIRINLAHHNTIGAPFLEQGCRISLSARGFMTAPAGTEFDGTGRLAQGVRFDSLTAAPLRSGGTADISVVPGMIGATDLVTGAVPRDLKLGWSCVLNPRLGVAYLCLFPGAAGLPEGEIALGFNDLWLQYGGRPFAPWAETEGGADRSFCLGTENAVGAFANGLEYSREHPELLGNPTLVEIPARGERRLHYATAIVTMSPELAQSGIERVEAEGGSLLLGGGSSSQSLPISADFELSRRLGRGLL